MEILSTDVLVIGSGLAGLVAALEADRPGLQIALLGKFGMGMGSNSSIANGGFTTANSRFSKEDHLRVTLEAGKGLNRGSLTRQMVEHGPEAMNWLKSQGVELVESAVGYWVGRSEGMSDLPGTLLMRSLVERLKGSSVRTLPGFVAFDLVVEEGEVRGVFGFTRDGRPFLIRSRATVLATGGAGAIYRRSDNQRTIRGDGYAMALRAGLPLHDLEFVQFYPLVLAEPRLSTLMLYPPYPKGIRLFSDQEANLQGSPDIPEDLNLAIMKHRDRVSIALYEACQKSDVYLDLTLVPEEAWRQYPLNFLKRSRFAFRERPFLVSPAVHFFMGGMEIDDQARAVLPGLFAAGEVAWGVHGANRVGGNALTECVVFGRLAGRSAAAYAESIGQQGEPLPPPDAVLKRWERKAGAYLKKRRGAFGSPRDLSKELEKWVWTYGGPIRDEPSLNEGLGRLASLKERIEEIYPATLNDLFRKKQLENMRLLAEALFRSSLIRLESRGSFFRADFPNQDDLNCLKRSCCRLVDGKIEATLQRLPA